MSNTLIINQPRVDVGLQTSTYTVPSGGAGLYNVRVQCTEIPPSGLSIVVNQNGSPVYTAATLGQTQSAIQFKAGAILCAAADVITVVFSSSSANDLLLNSVKSNVSIEQGA